MIVRKKEGLLCVLLLCNLLFLSRLIGHYYCIARIPESLPSHTHSGGIILMFYSSYEPEAAAGMEVLAEGYQFNQKTFSLKNYTGLSGMTAVPFGREEVLSPGNLGLDIKVHQRGLHKQFFLSLPVHLPVFLQSRISGFKETIGGAVLLEGTVIHPFNNKLLWKYPVEVQLINEEGKVLYRNVVLTGDDGVFKTNISVPEEIEKGWYAVRVHAGNTYDNHPVFLSLETEKMPLKLETSQRYFLPGEIFSADYFLSGDFYGNIEDEVLIHAEILAGRKQLKYEQNILSPGTGTLQAEIPGNLQEDSAIIINFSLESEKGIENQSFTVPLFLSPFRLAFFHHGYILAGHENLFGFVLTDPMGIPVSKWVTMRVQDTRGDTVYYRNNFFSSEEDSTLFTFSLPDSADSLKFHFGVEGKHFQFTVEPLHIHNYPFLFRPGNYRYNIGDMLELEFTTEKEEVAIVVEIERDGNLLYYREWLLSQPGQTLNILLGEEMAGNVLVTAHTYSPDDGQMLMSYPLSIINRNQQKIKDWIHGTENEAERRERNLFLSEAPRKMYCPLTEQFPFIRLIRNQRTSRIKTLAGYRGEWHEITPAAIPPSPFFFPEDLVFE